MRHRIVSRTLVGAASVTALASLAACGSSAKPTVTVAPKDSTAATSVATTKPTPTTASSATTTKPATTAVATTAKTGTGGVATTVKSATAVATTAKAGTAVTAAATVNVNTASDADLAKIPGITTQAIDTLKAGRPFANVAAFRTTMTKTNPAALETAIEKYLAF